MDDLALQALRFAVRIVTYPLDVFYQLLLRTSTLGIYWAFFMFAAVFRLLITPMIGNSMQAASSDMAQRKRTTKSNRRHSRSSEGN